MFARLLASMLLNCAAVAVFVLTCCAARALSVSISAPAGIAAALFGFFLSFLCAIYARSFE